MKVNIEYRISWNKNKNVLNIIISSPAKKFKYWNDNFIGSKDWGFSILYLTVWRYNIQK